MKANDKYLDMYGHKITITGVLDQCIYYESETKNFGLIDSKGRYFLQNSVYYINLKKRENENENNFFDAAIM